jgi:hypothetical protein
MLWDYSPYFECSSGLAGCQNGSKTDMLCLYCSGLYLGCALQMIGSGRLMKLSKKEIEEDNLEFF